MLQNNWHTYDHYGFAIAALLGTAIAVAVIKQWLYAPRWASWAQSLKGVVPPFINILGVLFGLTLAFLANDTWSAHDHAMRAVYSEADALRSLVTLSDKLPTPQKDRMNATLVAYAQASAQEWTWLAQRHQDQKVVALGDALLSQVTNREIEQAVGVNAQALMIAKASEIRNEREQRIALSQTHVNPLKWLGMAFLGLLTLLSIAVVHVEHPRAAMVAIILFALAAAPTAAIVLVQGNPFQEPTAVTADPILQAVDRLR